jgi:hypothetical protein
MSCTVVRQSPNHCVPACLESLAKDGGITSTSQKDIVEKFPSVFPGGVLNDVNKSPNLEDVVRDLGLADQIFRISFPSIETLAALCRENEILLMWTAQAKHCVRICGFDPKSQLFTVMDPEQDKLQIYDAARLNSLAPDLVYFKKRHCD